MKEEVCKNYRKRFTSTNQWKQELFVTPQGQASVEHSGADLRKEGGGGGGGEGGGIESPFRDSTACRPKGALFVLFRNIHFSSQYIPTLREERARNAFMAFFLILPKQGLFSALGELKKSIRST